MLCRLHFGEADEAFPTAGTALRTSGARLPRDGRFRCGGCKWRISCASGNSHFGAPNLDHGLRTAAARRDLDVDGCHFVG